MIEIDTRSLVESLITVSTKVSAASRRLGILSPLAIEPEMSSTMEISTLFTRSSASALLRRGSVSIPSIVMKFVGIVPSALTETVRKFRPSSTVIAFVPLGMPALSK